jgi:hypothetical protein
VGAPVSSPAGRPLGPCRLNGGSLPSLRRGLLGGWVWSGSPGALPSAPSPGFPGLPPRAGLRGGRALAGPGWVVGCCCPRALRARPSVLLPPWWVPRPAGLAGPGAWCAGPPPAGCPGSLACLCPLVSLSPHSSVGIEGLEHRTAWSFCRNRRTNESCGRAGRHTFLDEVAARLVGQQSEKRSDAAAHPAGLSDVVPARRHQAPPLVIAEHMASTRPAATDFGVTALFSPWLGFLILLIY